MLRKLFGWLALAALWMLTEAGGATSPPETLPYSPIILPADASPQERLAAREVRRYVYLRTGRLLPLKPAQAAGPGWAGAIVVANKDRPLVAGLVSDPQLKSSLVTLGPQQYWLKTLLAKGRPVVLLTGGDDVAVLYAAYRFAEHLGVRFYLHGDVVPDARQEFRLPLLDERAMPLFALRGIQPFHDFPEGPDWWNGDDYAAIIAQLAKLRLNFIGLHAYPENGPNAEPTVWIGPASELGENGQVKASYPSSYQNTLRGNWGYTARKTSDFVFGGAELFEHDGYGPEMMIGACPQPTAAEDCNAVFNRTGAMLREAFTLAHKLGVKTCVGTETPLTVPRQVADRLKAAGKNPADLAVVQELYEGIFRRVATAYPLDYYWFWTPEGWTWEGTKQEQVNRTMDDVNAAIGAAKKVGAPFQLATCGWVLGPQYDRALFDKALPKEVAVSCINREVGRTPVDKGFAEVRGRGKWAIPWMEDDPGLTSPQLWVGRMRRDAADARRYGCDGLLGIHWRTRVLGPNVSALAQAAWTQDAWNTSAFEPPPAPARAPGPVGGATAAYPNNPIADTADAPLYQTVRYNLSAYHLPAANGPCRVTLKFCEPHYNAAGKRVFSVKLQGKPVIENLDIFAKVGQNRALDYTFANVAVTNGWLDLEFVPVAEFPCIAAIVAQGAGFAHKINCGGAAYNDFAADWPVAPAPKATYPATCDFYSDWAAHEFGAEVGAQAAAIFEQVDCFLPRPSDWVDGPGGIRPDARPWEQAQKDYQFVDQFAALEPLPRGRGNRTRFHYWLETFRYLRAIAQVNCTSGAFNQALAKAKAGPDAEAQRRLARDLALPLRRQLVQQVGELYEHLFATVSTTGELGTVANWDQHNLPGLLTKPGEELARLLGEALPAEAQPAKGYHGPLRVIVPTVRSSLGTGEGLRLKVIILAEGGPSEALLWWRKLGTGAFRKVPLTHVARGVYSVQLPAQAAADADLEYYIEALTGYHDRAVWPPTAPALNHTVVRIP
jgi:hypothetical protein